MALYRIDRTLPNGWKMRLEMVSYDGSITDTPVNLGDVCLLKISSLKSEFDGIPYGLMQPMTLSFKLIWDQLPDAMIPYLETPSIDTDTVMAGYKRCSWYLYTDRGTFKSTGTATYALEFVGVEDNIEALELEPLDNGMYAYSIELVDAAYYWLKTTTAKMMIKDIGLNYNYLLSKYVKSDRSCWQVRFTPSNYTVNEQEHEFWSIDAYARFVSVYDLLLAYNYSSSQFNESIAHAGSSTEFDGTYAISDILTHTVGWYAPANTTTLPRNAASTALTKDKIYVIAEIFKNNDFTGIGGVCNPSDEYTIASANVSSYDVLRELAEQSAVRVGYRFARTGNDVYVVFYTRSITQGRDSGITSDTPDQTLNLDKALTRPKIVKRGDNILKAEVRYETQSDRDASSIVKVQRGARASRSYNVEPRLHNMPVDLQDKGGAVKNWPKFKAPIKQTNQLFVRGDYYSQNPSQFIKVHEKTKITYGAGASDYVVVDPDGLKYPVSAYDFSYNDITKGKYYLQLNDCQVNGCISAALCYALIKVFSDENNALVEVDWPLDYSTKLMPDYISGRFALSNGPIDKFSTINWDRAIPVSVDVDLIAGKASHKYFIVSA